MESRVRLHEGIAVSAGQRAAFLESRGGLGASGEARQGTTQPIEVAHLVDRRVQTALECPRPGQVGQGGVHPSSRARQDGNLDQNASLQRKEAVVSSDGERFLEGLPAFLLESQRVKAYALDGK